VHPDTDHHIAKCCTESVASESTPTIVCGTPEAADHEEDA